MAGTSYEHWPSMGITWAEFLKQLCLSSTPDQLKQIIWRWDQMTNLFTSPPVTLICSWDWEPPLHNGPYYKKLFLIRGKALLLRACSHVCFWFSQETVYFLIAGLLYSMPIKEGRRYCYHEVHDIGRALLCCNHCSTNEAPAREIKTTQPTDKGYGLRTSLHPSLTLRQESAFK